MSDALDRYRLLADDFSARVEAVGESAWGNSSPCDKWTARDVAEHVIGNHRAFVGLLDGVEPAAGTGDVAADWAKARAAVEAGLADPDRASRVVAGPLGEMPFEVLIERLLSVDMLVHTWDLARAAGLDERINADAAGHAYEGLQPLDAMLRGPGRFKPAVAAPEGADPQTRLLCFLGRQP